MPNYNSNRISNGDSYATVEQKINDGFAYVDEILTGSGGAIDEAMTAYSQLAELQVDLVERAGAIEGNVNIVSQNNETGFFQLTTATTLTLNPSQDQLLPLGSPYNLRPLVSDFSYYITHTIGQAENALVEIDIDYTTSVNTATIEIVYPKASDLTVTTPEIIIGKNGKGLALVPKDSALARGLYIRTSEQTDMTINRVSVKLCKVKKALGL